MVDAPAFFGDDWKWLSAPEVENFLSTLAKQDRWHLRSSFRTKGEETGNPAWFVIGETVAMGFASENTSVPFIGYGFAVETIPDDRLEWFEHLGRELVSPAIKARFADVAWVRFRSFSLAPIAVEAYRVAAAACPARPISHEGFPLFERGLRLALSAKVKVPSADEISSEAITLAERDTKRDYISLLNLLRLVRECNTVDNNRLLAICNKSSDAMLAIARRSHERKYFETARGFLRLSSQLARSIRDHERAAAAQFYLGRAFVEEADMIIASAPADQTPATCLFTCRLLESAIQELRQSEKGKADVPQLYDRLHADGEALARLFPPQSIKPDQDIIDESINCVSGRSFTDAMTEWTRVWTPRGASHYRNMAANHDETFFLSSLFNNISETDYRGRKVAQTNDDPENILNAKMERNAVETRAVVVPHVILPAFVTIKREHQPSYEQVSMLIRNSEFIPLYRLPIWTMGIISAFSLGLIVALPVLVPLIEHSLRTMLHARGVVTSSVDHLGVEKDWLLDRLLDAPEMVDKLGEEVVYDLKTLLIRAPYGRNIRHNMAHGLLRGVDLVDAQATYLFWLIVRVILTL